MKVIRSKYERYSWMAQDLQPRGNMLHYRADVLFGGSNY